MYIKCIENSNLVQEITSDISGKSEEYIDVGTIDMLPIVSKKEYEDMVYDSNTNTISIVINEARKVSFDARAARATRKKELNNLKVVVNTREYDANDIAQNRIARVIQLMTKNNSTEIKWRLANNEEAIVTKDELEEVLEKAILALGTNVLDTGIYYNTVEGS